MSSDSESRPENVLQALRESQALLKETEAAAHIGGWVFDVETLTQTWTEEVFRILEIDLTQGEPQVPEGLSFIAPAFQPMAQLAIQRAIELGEPYDQEWEVITARGNRRWVQAIAKVHQEEGKTKRVSGSFQDITPRKRAEQALHRATAILQAAMDQSPAGIAIADAPDGALHYVNDAGLLIRGGDRESIVKGVGIDQYVASWQLLDLDGRPLRSDEVPLARAVMFGETCSREFIVRRAANDDRIVLGNAAPIKNEDGEVVAGIVVFSDITERKQVEQALQKSRTTLNLVLDTVPQSIFWKDPEGRYLGCNQAFAAAVGLNDPSQIVGKTDFDLPWPHEEAEAYRSDDREVLENNRTKRHIVEPVQLADGSRVWVDTSKAPLCDAQGRPFAVLGVYEDITLRKQTEEALRASEEKLRAVLDTTPFPIAVVDLQDDQIPFWSRSALELFGHTAPTAAQWYELAYPDPDYRQEVFQRWKPSLEEARQSGQSVNTGEYRVTCADGSQRICELHAVFLPENLVVIFNDITKRKQAEAEQERLLAQLIQAQKMEAVGHLAGGIAHDFNNLLQVILGQVDQALEDMPPGSRLHKSLTEVEKAGERAAELTRQLLGFGRRQVMQPVHLDMNELVSGMLGMLRRVLGEHLELCFIAGDRLGMIHADKGQLEQVLLNLCVNARDAMPDGGTLTIETENVIVGKAYQDKHPFSIEGRYLLLSVTDTGCGMDEATQSQIFEPFYTTKAVGQGTGLGLSMVYGLVHQHRGSIEVYSEVGKGTCFKVYLPIAQRRAQDVEPKIQSRVVGGTETILVAEDESSVREVVTIFLERAGYTVLGASDGEEALRLFELHGDSIDLALLDVIMPKLGGREVMDRMVASGSQTRFLFSSGYSENAIHTNFVMKKGFQLVPKPHRKETLLRAVRQALDAHLPASIVSPLMGG